MTGDVIRIGKFQRPEILEPRVLGAMLDNGAHLKALLPAVGLAEECFPTPRGRQVWRLINHLLGKGSQVSGLLVISAGRLVHAFSPEDEAWITEVELANVVAVEQLEQLLTDLRRAHCAVQLAAICATAAADILARGLDTNRVWDAVEAAEGLLRAELPSGTAEGDLLELLDTWDRNRREGKKTLEPTGIRLLDEMFGGLPHSLTIIAGSPGTGKTGVVASMIRAQLEADPTLRLGVFGLEDRTQWLIRRHIARELCIPVRQVGALGTPELQQQHADCGPKFSAWLSRVHTYTKNRITPRELLLTAKQWVRAGVRCIFIDNASQLQLRSVSKFEQPHELLGEALEEFREFAMENQVALVLLMHTNEPDSKGKRAPGPPEMHMMRGGRSSDQKARLMLGIWRKDSSWRCTMLKGNELGEAGQTVEFDRLPEAALINPAGGRLVNLQQESAMERKAHAEDRAAEKTAALKKAAQVRAQLKAGAEAQVKGDEPVGQAALPLDADEVKP